MFDERHRGFWERCRRARPHEPLPESCPVRRMGNAPEIGERLLALVTSGQKTGVFSRPQDLAAAGESPRPGGFLLFTDHSDRPRCVVQFEECRLLRFDEVGTEMTSCESPAARDVEVWRGIHRRYWTPVFAAEGKEFSEAMPVLFQRFRLVYSEE